MPVQLAGMLRAQGIDVQTTLDVGALGRPDDEQLAFAATAGRVVVTHNRLDFEELHTLWSAEGRPHCGIIVARNGATCTSLADRILDLLNRFYAEQLRDQLFYV